MHFENCVDPERCWCEAKRYLPILWIGSVLFTVEFFGGVLSGSLALIADAFHVFTDNGAVLNALLVVAIIRFYSRRVTALRVRSIGARIQALLILGTAVWIAYEAMERFMHPAAVRDSILMIGIAIFGTAVNGYMHLLLHWKEGNITAIALDRHILGDLAQSIVIVVGAGVIALTGALWIDPALSLLVAAAMGYWGAKTFKESFS